MSHFSELSIVPEPSADVLNQRQIIDYRSQREDCLEWLLTFGKDPERAEGYAFQTVRNRASRMDAFYRWVWEYEGRYTASLTHDHGDEWLRHLARHDKSNAHKDNCRKAAQMLFKWRHHEHGLDEWDPELSFSSGSKTTTPRDYLTETERSKVREAALEYGSVPAYSDLSPTQRSRWKAYLAQRFEKPNVGRHQLVHNLQTETTVDIL